MNVAVSVCAIALLALSTSGNACSVTGTAFTSHGKPLQGAVVRLVDLDSQMQAFALTDARANYSIDTSSISGQRVRVDIISDPTVVTGSHLPTRSILGESDTFACAAGSSHQDVHIQAD